jgi:hypothetical protein
LLLICSGVFQLAFYGHLLSLVTGQSLEHCLYGDVCSEQSSSQFGSAGVLLSGNARYVSPRELLNFDLPITIVNTLSDFKENLGNVAEVFTNKQSKKLLWQSFQNVVACIKLAPKNARCTH